MIVIPHAFIWGFGAGVLVTIGFFSTASSLIEYGEKIERKKNQ